MDLARASKGQILQSLARQTKPSSWQGFVYARTVAFHRIIEISELEGTHKVHRVQLLSLRKTTPKFPPCVYRHICRNLGKQKSGSCRRGGIERHFYPTFQPCFPWMWWRATIKCEPCIPTIQSLTRSEKSKSQDTGDLKPCWTQKLSALSRRNRRESVLTRLHGKVCRPIFRGAQVHSNMCCMGGGCLWGARTPWREVPGMLKRSWLFLFFSPLAPKYFCYLQKEVRCCSSPLDGFYIAQLHHCVSNKAIKSITRSSLHGLKQYKSLLQRTRLTWGWMDWKIFQVILS